MKKYIYTVILVTAFASCNQKSDTEESTPSKNYLDQYNDENKLKELSIKIISTGDTIAFQQMSDIYWISGHRHEFLYYAIRIANDYQYHDGYYEAYSILHTDIKTNTNKKTNDLANYYLLKAYELGNKSAKRNLKNRFPKEQPSSEEYWQTINH